MPKKHINPQTALRIWASLDQGLHPLDVAQTERVNERTVQRLVTVRSGLEQGRSDSEISRSLAGSWSPRTIADLRETWQSYADSREKNPAPVRARIQALVREEADRREAERERAQWMKDHWQGLLADVADIRQVEAFPLHHYDLALWFSRPADPCWPMAQGRMCRDATGSVTVIMDVQEQEAWFRLRQHLPSEPLWAEVEAWKSAVAKDLSARIALLVAVTQHIELSPSAGGLGLPVLAEVGFSGTPEPAVSLFYAFSIYDRALSLALGVRSAPHGPEAFTRFRSLESSVPKVIDLEGRLVISAEDCAQVQQAKDFLYRTEAEWVGRPETQAAAEAYRRAGERTEALKAGLARVQAMEAFPPGSLCDGCKG